MFDFMDEHPKLAAVIGMVFLLLLAAPSLSQSKQMTDTLAQIEFSEPQQFKVLSCTPMTGRGRFRQSSITYVTVLEDANGNAWKSFNRVLFNSAVGLESIELRVKKHNGLTYYFIDTERLSLTQIR